MMDGIVSGIFSTLSNALGGSLWVMIAFIILIAIVFFVVIGFEFTLLLIGVFVTIYIGASTDDALTPVLAWTILVMGSVLWFGYLKQLFDR